MDFQTHERQPAPGPNTNRFAAAGNQPEPAAPPPPGKPAGHRVAGRDTFIRALLVIFLLCLVALVVAVLLVIGRNNPASESKYVNTSEYQAVDVASPGASPVYYFGKIAEINDKYLILDHAFALTSSPSDKTVSVEPLACVGPNSSDQLVFSRSEVVFWNNLDSSSSAAEAINQQINNATTCPAASASSPVTSTPASQTTSTSPSTPASQPAKTSSSPSSQTSASPVTSGTSAGTSSGATAPKTP